ncbi:MAG: DNA polymerase IV [Paracoccaceae bacterium]|nr:DNA polymerase IV [Paracoccaceae bacterium]
MPSLCRKCFNTFTEEGRCPICNSPLVVSHDELFSLNIAHMDCDAFYASVEKRDNPELADKPVIIGGGRRGVVSTACYIARICGVKSAMPMFKALEKCPDAVVIRPRMKVYAEISQQIRIMMTDITPMVEPLSLDEAFMDLSGTHKLHGVPPAVMLAKLMDRISGKLGLTGSIGLSHNKFLAKIASDLNKPNGYSIIGEAETGSFLKDKSVRLIWGVGSSAQKSLEKAGIRTFSDLLRWDRKDLAKKFGSMGDRLWFLAKGQDARIVSNNDRVKSISNETTLFENTSDLRVLEGHLWRLCEKVSSRAKSKGLAGSVVILKLKSSNHKLITRRLTLRDPTHLADILFRSTYPLMKASISNGPFRLVGIGLSGLCFASQAEREPELLDNGALKRIKVERVTDEIREKYGDEAVIKGRSLL